MNSTLGRILSLLARDVDRAAPALDGFFDSLLQKFENSRPGLTDAQLGDPAAVQAFFARLYEDELPRLAEVVRQQEPLLTTAAKEEFFRKVDTHVREVVLPAYVRLAASFTKRERNDFYLLPEPLHGVERLLFGVAGLALGALVVWAPFIPLWSKEWVVPFILGGLLFPNLRRYLSLRGYEGELNGVVGRADLEIGRIDMAYFDSAEALSERAAAALPGAVETTTAAHARAAQAGQAAQAAGGSPREGGR
jgi:hypothetical protein